MFLLVRIELIIIVVVVENNIVYPSQAKCKVLYELFLIEAEIIRYTEIISIPILYLGVQTILMKKKYTDFGPCPMPILTMLKYG